MLAISPNNEVLQYLVFSNSSSGFEDYLMQHERSFYSDETKYQNNPTY